ncbi:putative secreted protein (Por secretion system target) [Jejuia pallidilutea]|uniref:Putative secreted protein (Por secretion system target) n=1 Tax=Jejuia pallidilutea TaxID=504487 RepID=A0A362WZ89_9FLAO|nr:LamG-like jellyroll fold domain-containing protein [Jejuia pallidilutea]PQV46974.1 putative secreted protein (Por secretion system target) [Jejuia pallidilutea]
MKHIAIIILMTLSLCFFSTKTYAQLHTTPECGNNFSLKWSTFPENSNEYGWHPGTLSNTFTNVDNSDVDVTVSFTGETNSFGFWAGNTPKIGTQSSYLYKGIDLLTNGFNSTGITCTVTFSKPIYALSFDIHHINVYNVNGDKYTITGKNTKGDTIYPEFTPSPSPSYTSDSATGIVNAVSNLTSGENPMVGVNFSDPNYITSISILWEDCNTCETQQPHATGIGDFSFCTPQLLDFDGADDYINTAPFLGGNNELTIMSWIKLDNNFDRADIMGQRNFRLFIDINKKLRAFLKTDTGLDIFSPEIDEALLKENIWQHVALAFNGKDGTVQLYLNGQTIWSYSDNALTNTKINNSSDWNADYDFEIGRNTQNKNNYFKGAINEVRVYKKALSKNQLHYQINQKIENSNGKISGTTIPKDIEGLLWNDLILYYKMDIDDTGYTPDSSVSSRNGILHNMTSFQEYSAPLPYVTNTTTSGHWNDTNSWRHGNVWDIQDKTPEHAIIKIKGNLEIDKTINTTGLILEQGAILTVNKNAGLFNSWYLKLNGTLKLNNASQLIQTPQSTLDESSSGILEKDLKGTADKYTYNYWASPVGKRNNIKNNSNYSVKDIFKNVEFLTSGYNGSENPLGIADYWIWKFSNKLSDDYASWQHVRSSGEITPGEGFTMKGPGTGSIDEQQKYILKGKPNNGSINLTVNAGNDYLVGNPYPSSIDAVQFLLDNKSTISGLGTTNGTLYFWKHWGGGSHIANEYQGGYATFSLSGGLPAATQGNNNIGTFVSKDLVEIPDRFIPVGQGFYITSETNGTINFNNGQRIFYPEDDTTNSKDKYKTLEKSEITKTIDSRMKLRIGFNSTNAIKRQLLFTVDKNATSGVDWGYDSKYIDTQIDDMYWMLNNEKYLIQAVDTITTETIIPLGIHTDTAGYNSITVDRLENPARQDLKIYLHDKDLNIYHNLKKSKYETYLTAGSHLNRFEITFSKSQTLSSENKVQTNTVEAYYSKEKSSIIINNPLNQTIKSVEMFNILGQSLFHLATNSNNEYVEYRVPQNILGNYILNIETALGKTTKKILIR